MAPRFRLLRAGLLALLFLTPGLFLGSHPLQKDPLAHIIIIMQENHSFDNYFGTYPTANGTLVDNITSHLASVNGIPDGTCLRYGRSCISPYLSNTTDPANPIEGQVQYENDYAKGLNFPNSSGLHSMVYFDYRTIPAYWDYAEEFGIADNYFSAVLAQTTPNRLMLLSGDSPVSSNYGPPPLVPFNTTLLAQLSENNISWGYYDSVSRLPNSSQVFPLDYLGGAPPGATRPNDSSTLLENLNSGKGLPAVSFVNAIYANLSEHPPGTPAHGEAWVVSIVNAVMKSSYWNSTAIFITYDEGGGFFDHVIPPSQYAIDHHFDRPLKGLGQRVPLLVISPYSKVNFVSHQLMSHLSLLRFVEYTWGLPPLNDIVARANIPLDFFNFAQPPRVPIILPESRGQLAAGYPLPLQSKSGTGSQESAPLTYYLLPLAVGCVILASVFYIRASRTRPH